MRISEATIRSIVRKKLIEAVTVGSAGGSDNQKLTISIPLKSTRNEVKNFLDKLDDGSKIYVDNTLLWTKKGGLFVNDTPDDSGATDRTINTNLFVIDIFSGQHKLDEYEVYNSKNEKVAVDDLTAAAIDDAISGVNAAGSSVDSEKAALAKWQKEVSARPLQIGSKGPNVGKLQDILKTALSKMSDHGIDIPDTSVRDIKSLIAAGKVINPANVTPSSQDLVIALADSLDVDNDFGPVTKAAVIVFQQLERPLQPDGKVGKDTAAALVKYANPG